MKSAPYGVIKNSEFAYLDENDLYRVEMSNKIDNVDFYTVAISDQLMKTAYDSLMESIPDTSDTNLKVYEIYLYIDEPLAAGVWGGYYDYDKYIW